MEEQIEKEHGIVGGTESNDNETMKKGGQLLEGKEGEDDLYNDGKLLMTLRCARIELPRLVVG